MISEKAFEFEGPIFTEEDELPEVVRVEVDEESLFYGIDAEPEALRRLGDFRNFRPNQNRTIEPQVIDFLSSFLNKPWRGRDAFRAAYLVRLFLRVAVQKYPGLQTALDEIEGVVARWGEWLAAELRRREANARDAG